jgi:hypothetical protein
LVGKITSVDMNIVDRSAEPDKSINVSEKTSPHAEILTVILNSV